MRKILFIFIFMVLVGPLQVKAAAFYFNHSDYYYSEEEVEKNLTTEVSTITKDGKTIYQYRNRDYLILPDELIEIKSVDFDLLDLVETSLPKEDLKVKYLFDFKENNHSDGQIDLSYKNRTLNIRVRIEIDNYIEVPDEIVIEDYNFNIWDYIKTNIEPKADIKIIGEYDINTNGEYEVLISYEDISKKTIILINIEENNKEDVLEKEEEKKDNNYNDTEDVIPNEKILTYETKNYINNYYTYNNEEISECSCNDIRIPVPINKTIYNDSPINDLFCYISYVFYGLVIILLSIFVVRKK